MWRFRGSPHYIDQQGDRLGVPKILTDRARHNPEIYRVSVLIGQLCERYHRAPKEGGCAVVLPAELSQIRGTLSQCEQELEKLHVLAAATQVIVDEANQAFGLAPPNRRFRVRCDYDDRVEPAELTPETVHADTASAATAATPPVSESHPEVRAKPRHSKAIQWPTSAPR